jgi:hypothetical protein
MVAAILDHLRFYPKVLYPESGTDLANHPLAVNIRKPCSTRENHASLDQYRKCRLQGSARGSTTRANTAKEEAQVFKNVCAVFAPEEIAMADLVTVGISSGAHMATCR